MTLDTTQTAENAAKTQSQTQFGAPVSKEAASTSVTVPTAASAAAAKRRERLFTILIPIGVIAALIALWHIVVQVNDIPHYILPGPGRVLQSLISDWPVLLPALWVTTKITLMSLALALLGGGGMAILLVQSRWVETALYPIMVILQVTPIIAIAPLILIYAPTTQSALLICAFVVAFFPILSNMVQGLKSVDHNLLNLFELYGASRWQTLIFLKLPSCLPYFMTGLRIGGGLALIAAVVAEFAAGSAGAGSGLAFRLLESQFRLNISRLFAALFLLASLGVLIFAITSFISWWTLHRWHESSVKREN